MALEKTKGDTAKAIELLRKYIDIFMTDTEAWAELSDLYVQVDSFSTTGPLLGCGTQGTVPYVWSSECSLIVTWGEVGGGESVCTFIRVLMFRWLMVRWTPA